MLSAQQRAPGDEQSLLVVGDAEGMVYDLGAVIEEGGDRIGISAGDRSIEAGGMGGRGVWSYTLLLLRRGSRWQGRVTRRHRLGRQLIQARERLDLTI